MPEAHAQFTIRWTPTPLGSHVVQEDFSTWYAHQLLRIDNYWARFNFWGPWARKRLDLLASEFHFFQNDNVRFRVTIESYDIAGRKIADSFLIANSGNPQTPPSVEPSGDADQVPPAAFGALTAGAWQTGPATRTVPPQ